MMKYLLLVLGLNLSLFAHSEQQGPNLPADAIDQQVPNMILRRSVDALMQNQPAWVIDLLPNLRAEHREALLFESLRYLHLNQHIPDQTLKNWLLELASERPLVREAAVIDGYEVIRPSYDYPALARSLILNQVSAERSQLYLTELLRDDFQWSLVFRRNNPLILAQQLDLKRAFSQLNSEQLHYVKKAMPGKLFFPDNSVVVALALGIATPEAIAEVLRLPMDQYSVSLLEWVRLQMPPELAFEILMDAADNPELLYFAYSAIARLGRVYPPAAQFILEQFRDSEHKELAAIVMIEMQSR
ncbi:hypothetical protein ACVFI8_09990 [Agarivorans sp. MS3-6]|uniref:hypothetical protein n=1 Tax=Agarivorans sp. TSD2052 TaxID=2937286 RepID=UPI00200D7A97|nr:hypothetical protein [Agarivorans sp. TSD2052]UPW18506.1 hypothetical protein M0C34_20175 [Agarivorans sp. TSD2052]